MQQKPDDVDTMKTCCGALAILSRDEGNKLMIVRDGLRLILSTMQIHSRREDLLEAACDLLWSLAFNNDVVKDLIGRQGGIQVVLHAMSLHAQCADLLKSACGTLSNLCQNRDNQTIIGREGGIKAILSILQSHSDPVLLPFVFDALASLIVGHKANSTALFRAGAIPLVLRCLQKHIGRGELLKSGYHALAILSDVEGHGGAIAEAGGVQALVTALRAHPKHTELQRVSAVVLLRMLHEAHVAAELATSGGIPLMLNIVKEQVNEVETAAAACHILYSITDRVVGKEAKLDKLLGPDVDITGLLKSVRMHSGRLDLIRAACRTLANLSDHEKVALSMSKTDVSETMLRVVMRHPQAVDVAECTSVVLIALARVLPDRTAVELPLPTVPALLQCLSSHPDSSSLRRVVFSILAKQWEELAKFEKAKQDSSVPHSIKEQAVRMALMALSNPSWRKSGRAVSGAEDVRCCCAFLKRVVTTKAGDHLLRQRGIEVLRNVRAGLDSINLDSKVEDEIRQSVTFMLGILGEEGDKDASTNGSSGSSSGTSSTGGGRANGRGGKRTGRGGSKAGGQTGVSRPSHLLKRNQPVHPLADNNHPNQGRSANSAQLLDWSPAEPSRCLVPKPELAVELSDMEKRRAQEMAEGTRKMRTVYEGRECCWHGPPSKAVPPYPYHVTTNWDNDEQHSLTFDSNFESGNLLRATQVGSYEYDLVLRPDIHTQGYTQWFYFAVSNTHPVVTGNPATPSPRYRFNIVNMAKPDSLYNQGQRICLYSCQNAKEHGIGWQRAGTDICYYTNSFPKHGGKNGECYHSLTFHIIFPHSGDTFLFAHSYPYTTLDNHIHVQSLLTSPATSRYVKRQVMCNTLHGNECALLTITDFQSAAEEEKRGHRRKAIVISARVHPGEPQASWMMKGVLDFLTGSSKTARILRNTFCFKIVPVLNPDGVMLGNNRCSLSGCDLNRQWKRPSRTLHPTVYYTKAMIRAENTHREVVLYLDLHGHSRKKNVFMYGCDDKRRPRPTVRVFPKLLSWTQQGRSLFSFQDCSFQVRKGRDSTARVVVAKELGINNAFTCEASFCGPNFGPHKDTHFTPGQLQEVGVAACEAMLDYYMPDPQHRERLTNVLEEVQRDMTDTSKKGSTGAEDIDSDGDEESDSDKDGEDRDSREKGEKAGAGGSSGDSGTEAADGGSSGSSGGGSGGGSTKKGTLASITGGKKKKKGKVGSSKTLLSKKSSSGAMARISSGNGVKNSNFDAALSNVKRKIKGSRNGNSGPPVPPASASSKESSIVTLKRNNRRRSRDSGDSNNSSSSSSSSSSNNQIGSGKGLARGRRFVKKDTGQIDTAQIESKLAMSLGEAGLDGLASTNGPTLSKTSPLNRKADELPAVAQSKMSPTGKVGDANAAAEEAKAMAVRESQSA
jgi:uncharacterized membrane protein YgcG